MGCGPSRDTATGMLKGDASTSTIRIPMIEDEATHIGDEETSSGEWGALLMYLRYDEKRQQLAVMCKRAHGLKNKDTIGLSDPFVVCQVSPSSLDLAPRKTKVRKNTLEPVWDQQLIWKAPLEVLTTEGHAPTPETGKEAKHNNNNNNNNSGNSNKDNNSSNNEKASTTAAVPPGEEGAAATLTVTLWDYDHIGRNDFLGRFTLPLGELMRKPTHGKEWGGWMQLFGRKPGLSAFNILKISPTRTIQRYGADVPTHMHARQTRHYASEVTGHGSERPETPPVLLNATMAEKHHVSFRQQKRELGDIMTEAEKLGAQREKDGAPPRKLVVLYNPVSGDGTAKKIVDKLATPVFRAAGVDYDVIPTQYAGHATEFTLEMNLDSVDGILIAGGDGLVTEVITGYFNRADQGRGVPVGILPSGTANALAHDLHVGVSHSQADVIGRAALNACKGNVRKIDVLKVEGEGGVDKYAMSVCGWGLAGAVANTAARLRWIPGQKSVRYDLAGFVTMMGQWPVVDRCHMRFLVKDGGREHVRNQKLGEHDGGGSVEREAKKDAEPVAVAAAAAVAATAGKTGSTGRAEKKRAKKSKKARKFSSKPMPERPADAAVAGPAPEGYVWIEEEVNLVNLLVSNLPRLGLDHAVTKDMVVNSGDFCVLVCDGSANRRDVIQMASVMKKGRFLEEARVARTYRCKAIEIIPLDCKHANPFLIDGDAMPAGQAVIRNLHELIGVFADKQQLSENGHTDFVEMAVKNVQEEAAGTIQRAWRSSRASVSAINDEVVVAPVTAAAAAETKVSEAETSSQEDGGEGTEKGTENGGEGEIEQKDS